MKTYVKEWLRERVGWTATVRQARTIETLSSIVRVGPRAEREYWWRRRWQRYTALHRLRGASQHAHTSTFTECAHARIVSSVSYTSSILTLAQVRALSALHPHVIHVCDFFTLIFSALYFLVFLPSLFLFLTNKKFMENLWGHLRRPLLSPQVTSSVPLSYKIPATDQDVDDLTLGEMLTAAHRGQVDYSVREGVLSRRHFPIEQGNLLEIDRGNPMSTKAQKHSLGLYLMSKDSSCGMSRKSQSSRTPSSSSRRRAPTLSGTTMATEIGISWSSSTKSYRNGTITAIPEFYVRYDRETKTHRGPEHYFGIDRQSTGIAKWSKLYEWFQGFYGCWIDLQWKFTRYQSTSVIPTSSNAWRDVEAFLRNAAPQRRAAKHLGHTWYIGKRYFKSGCVIISTILKNCINGIHQSKSRSIHPQWRKSQRQEQDQDLRCQSGPSTKDSVIFSGGGDSSKNNGADQQRLQISDLHFDKFPTPATFACWKIRFKTEVCTCSQFPTEAMQWIKEVELVDSVDELRSSSSTRGISMPNFEVLDARIASKGKLVWRNKSPRSRTVSFVAGRLLEYFRVTGSPWFCRKLHRLIHYCSSKWRYSGIRF